MTNDQMHKIMDVAIKEMESDIKSGFFAVSHLIREYEIEGKAVQIQLTITSDECEFLEANN